MFLLTYQEVMIVVAEDIQCCRIIISQTLFVVVITPFFPWDGNTAQTAIQVHAVNLIKIRIRERWQPILNQP